MPEFVGKVTLQAVLHDSATNEAARIAKAITSGQIGR
jgi:hypothetical protein